MRMHQWEKSSSVSLGSEKFPISALLREQVSEMFYECVSDYAGNLVDAHTLCQLRNDGLAFGIVFVF